MERHRPDSTVKGAYEVLKGHLDLLLLAAIEEHPTHGYAIAERLRARSAGAFDLPEGTLYPALHRLERAGWLSSKWSEANGRRRRVYQITAKGQRARSKEQNECWSSSRSASRGVRGHGGPPPDRHDVVAAGSAPASSASASKHNPG